MANQDDISPPEVPGEEGEREREREDYRELQRKMQEKDEEIRQLRQSLAEGKSRADDQIMSLEKRLAKLEKAVNNPDEAILQRHQPPIQQPQNLPLPFIVQGFAELQRTKTSWTSKPFKPHDNGPGLQLVVWPQGQGEGASTHVSVWLEKEKASLEDENFEPFTISLTLELVPARSDSYQPPKAQVTKWFNIYSPGYLDANMLLDNQYMEVSNTFVAHSDLEDPLTGDCLKLRITSIQIMPLQFDQTY